VPDGDHAHGAAVSEFVDDPVDANPVGPQPGEPSTSLVAEVRVAFELTERSQHRVGAQEVERGTTRTLARVERDPGRLTARAEVPVRRGSARGRRAHTRA
jgi:hypothetical protein